MKATSLLYGSYLHYLQSNNKVLPINGGKSHFQNNSCHYSIQHIEGI